LKITIIILKIDQPTEVFTDVDTTPFFSRRDGPGTRGSRLLHLTSVNKA
jgi:hypothetical protein